MTCKHCKIMYRPRKEGGYYVELCPLHAAAGEMREALQNLKYDENGIPTSWPWVEYVNILLERTRDEVCR